jgi:hypothetical protein
LLRSVFPHLEVRFHKNPQIDGEYWFPVYSRSDDVLNFSTGRVHIREIIKYSDHQRSAASPQKARGRP